MAIDFADSPGPSLGVEWEFALVDQKTRDLTNKASEVFDLVAQTHGPEPRLHKELLRNTVELTTGICTNTSGAMAELT
ncbi:MAG: glutamate-cysteine ligase family protein, partial [Marmoricola sp.]